MPVEDFSALLGTLSSLQKDPLEESSPITRVSSSVAHAVFSLGAGQTARSAQRPSIYYEEIVGTPPAQQPPSLADLRRQVAEASSVGELHHLRRSFARACHPDCRGRSEGYAATYEMAAANELIDRAIASMRRKEMD
jgi:hypothetical protein